jgi:hypothetical protein
MSVFKDYDNFIPQGFASPLCEGYFIGIGAVLWHFTLWMIKEHQQRTDDYGG